MRECWPGWRERKTLRHGVEVIRPGEKLILIDTDHFNENPGLYLAHAIAHLDLHLKLLPAWFSAQQCEDADFHATTRLDGEEDGRSDRVRHEMRTSGPLGTLHDLEMALEYAKQGATVSDTGPEPEVLEALDAVAMAAPNPPKRLLDKAMDAYAARPATDHESRG